MEHVHAQVYALSQPKRERSKSNVQVSLRKRLQGPRALPEQGASLLHKIT